VLGASWYVAFPLGLAAYFILRFAPDAHQNLSFKLGFAHGKRGKLFKCPWWVDRVIYGLAYIEGRKAYQLIKQREGAR